MSLILDALSRAEREKREQAAVAPSILSQEIKSERAGAGAGKGAWILAFTVLVIIAAGAFSFWLFREEPPLRPQPGAAKNASEDRSAAAVISRERAPPRPSLPPPSVTTSSQPLSMPEPQEETRKSAAAVAALYAEKPERAAAEPVQKSQQLQATVASETIPTVVVEPVVEEAIDVERVLRELRVEAAKDTLQPHPVPLLEELSKQFKDRVPTLMYSRHDYNAAGTSTVTINGENLRPTQRTRGVEVREILSDSVILRFDSTDFRLRALNSWVNL
ncbi:general secretion pathway protein GspB [Congregibacter sp.]|uniref:general secretion pathway protein GspB n=1 Tax=Congregibacter sp. TaxID=2744308 RepID=UPI003F6AFC13